MNHKLQGVCASSTSWSPQPSTQTTLQRLEDTFDSAEAAGQVGRPGADGLQLLELLVHATCPNTLSDRDQVGYSASASGSLGRAPVGPNEARPAGQPRRLLGHPGQRPDRPAGDPSAGLPTPSRRIELPILARQPLRPTGQPTTSTASGGQSGLRQLGRDCQAGQTGYPLGECPVPGQSPNNPARRRSRHLPGSRGMTDLFWNAERQRAAREQANPSHQHETPGTPPALPNWAIGLILRRASSPSARSSRSRRSCPWSPRLRGQGRLRDAQNIRAELAGADRRRRSRRGHQRRAPHRRRRRRASTAQAGGEQRSRRRTSHRASRPRW